MAQILGKKWVCERCKSEVFLECTGKKSLDGGFTEQYIYAELPGGWGVGIIWDKSVELCPECREEYKRMCERFFEDRSIRKNDKKRFMKLLMGRGVSRNVAREVVKTLREMREAEDKRRHYNRIGREYQADLASIEYDILRHRAARWVRVTARMQQAYAEKTAK